jgi:hypothetical protein
MHVLKAMNTVEPPIKEMSFKDVLNLFTYPFRDMKRSGQERTVSRIL